MKSNLLFLSALSLAASATAMAQPRPGRPNPRPGVGGPVIVVPPAQPVPAQPVPIAVPSQPVPIAQPGFPGQPVPFPQPGFPGGQPGFPGPMQPAVVTLNAWYRGQTQLQLSQFAFGPRVQRRPVQSVRVQAGSQAGRGTLQIFVNGQPAAAPVVLGTHAANYEFQVPGSQLGAVTLALRGNIFIWEIGVTSQGGFGPGPGPVQPVEYNVPVQSFVSAGQYFDLTPYLQRVIPQGVRVAQVQIIGAAQGGQFVGLSAVLNQQRPIGEFQVNGSGLSTNTAIAIPYEARGFGFQLQNLSFKVTSGYQYFVNYLHIVAE